MPQSGALVINENSSELAFIINKAESMARVMLKHKNEELVELSVKSGDRIHRIAAAIYFGYRMDPNDCLFVLMGDSDPLVVDAARLACVHIANNKYIDKSVVANRKGLPYQQGHIIDFGPWVYRPGDNAKNSGMVGEDPATMKSGAIDLWQSFFSRQEKNLKAKEVVSK